ncbi:nucleotidyltransferase family protein [Loktanella sp. SALINAS62]|uniref:nucleotidyltransferase family protein n=1 Tax=Loktanella sp. SALINAS62 TaxID=2706124 RepID=UPI001B8B9076|nr:nucleotidyltransferase family protein [Loktanella sp. SALINAS62]MBS1302894.1 nucleotidyltransferase family protein [Loktanella sp. SALINAS62]
MIPIVILAAGTSSRMRGVDKLTQLIDGQPLLRRVAARACPVGTVFVALHPDASARASVLDGLPVTPLMIADAAEGLSSTMRGAVAALPVCPAFMLVLADLPDLTTADLAAVMAARDTDPDALIWRGATPDGKPGHPILFDASLRQRFADLSGDTGGDSIVKPLRDRTHLVRFTDGRARLDLDTPEAWDAWRATH